MPKMFGRQGWHNGQIETRFVNTTPSSFDADSRSVNAVISTGSPVLRFYGIEELRISENAIDTSRVTSGQCPLLDSHQSDGISHALGRVSSTWIKSGALWAELQFNRTDSGDRALGMVARGELSGVSCGYRVTAWEVSDEDGRIIDQEHTYWADGDCFTYTALNWELLEVSLVSVAADASASIRNFLDNAYQGSAIADVRTRIEIRHRIHARQQALFGDR
jgi:phage head maturation protease